MNLHTVCRCLLLPQKRSPVAGKNAKPQLLLIKLAILNWLLGTAIVLHFLNTNLEKYFLLKSVLANILKLSKSFNYFLLNLKNLKTLGSQLNKTRLCVL